MRVFILSSRDTISNIVLILSFNVTFGPPSRVHCRYESTVILYNQRDHPNLSREVIRSQYVSSSQTDMTRVTVKVFQSIRVKRTYFCQVFVEGRRRNIVSGDYDFLQKGDRTTTVTVTGKSMVLYCDATLFISSQLQAGPLVSLPAGPATLLSWSPGLPQHHHQLAMRCSIRPQLGSVADSVEGTLATLS